MAFVMIIHTAQQIPLLSGAPIYIHSSAGQNPQLKLHDPYT